MPLLQTISERCCYIPGANNLGVVMTGDDGAIVIDTGLDKDTGRLIRKALDEAGLRLRAIVNTHHHADHIGGNDYLLRNLATLPVYAPRLEAALIEHPLLEPVYLNMGAAPFRALQNKWLMAKGSPVDQIIADDHLVIDDVTFEVLPLAGHSLNQIGLAVDGVCFAADGFFGQEVLEKHGIPYAQEVDGQISSLRRLAERPERWFVPGHGTLTPQSELAAAVAVNLAAIERATQAVHAALAEPGDLAAIARRVAGTLGLTIAGIPQYAIFLSVVAAHLGALETRGQAQVKLASDGIVWQQISAGHGPPDMT